MRVSRVAVVLVPVTAAAVLAATPSVRKDPHGVYAVVDSVIFEPSTGTAERVQLWGSFALANVVGMKDGKINHIQIGHFDSAKAGYMYYRANDRDEAGTRAEWARLKAIAGTGQATAWGAHLPPEGARRPMSMEDTAAARWIMGYNGRVRAPSEPLASPDVFPQRMVPGSGPDPVSLTRAMQLGLPARVGTSASPRTAPPPRD